MLSRWRVGCEDAKEFGEVDFGPFDKLRAGFGASHQLQRCQQQHLSAVGRGFLEAVFEFSVVAPSESLKGRQGLQHRSSLGGVIVSMRSS